MQEQNSLILKVALLAGQIMCESNAESYRVEDTMNRILTLSNAEYATALSYSTSIFAYIENSSNSSKNISGMRRITSRSNDLSKISAVNNISRELIAGKITLQEASLKLEGLRSEKSEYSMLEKTLGVIIISASFSILFGGGKAEFIASIINGSFLSVLYYIMEKYPVNDALTHVIQSFFVTLIAHLLRIYIHPTLNADIVVVSTLMPLVPGTAITNSLRDIFREDYIAGSSRAIEAVFIAIMIAIGSVIAFTVIRGLGL